MGARVLEPQLSQAWWSLLLNLHLETPPVQATPGYKTEAPDAGFEVVTLPSLIGQIWLWHKEATFSSRTPHPAHNPPQEYFDFFKANSQTENKSNAS